MSDSLFGMVLFLVCGFMIGYVFCETRKSKKGLDEKLVQRIPNDVNEELDMILNVSLIGHYDDNDDIEFS